MLLYSCVFSPLTITITSLGEERANLSAFFTLFDLRLFVLSVFSFFWCLGRAVACDCGIPGRFSYLFLRRLNVVGNNSSKIQQASLKYVNIWLIYYKDSVRYRIKLEIVSLEPVFYI